MLCRTFSLALTILPAACGSTACPDIACGSPAVVAFTRPLSWAGTYRFTVSTGRELAICEVTLPAKEDALCHGSGASASMDVLIEAGQATALRIRPDSMAAFTLEIDLEGTTLLTTLVAPRYSEGDGCGCGATGQASVDTSRILFPIAGAGGASSAGGSAGVGGSTVVGGAEPMGGSGGDGGAAGSGGCDPTEWSGIYDVELAPVDSDCPDLGLTTWELQNGVEQSLECAAQAIQWSADQCTRTSHLACDNREGTTSGLDLVLSQSPNDPSLLKGIGHFEASGVVTCEGDYRITYTRR